MSGNRRGHDRERRVVDFYRDRDWLAFRAPASLGVADVVAIRAAFLTPGLQRSVVELCEVKSTAGGPYEHFGPADRARLSDAARMCGATAVLAWWPPRGKLMFIPEAEWPEPRKRRSPERGEENAKRAEEAA